MVLIINHPSLEIYIFPLIIVGNLKMINIKNSLNFCQFASRKFFNEEYLISIENLLIFYQKI